MESSGTLSASAIKFQHPNGLKAPLNCPLLVIFLNIVRPVYSPTEANFHNDMVHRSYKYFRIHNNASVAQTPDTCSASRNGRGRMPSLMAAAGKSI